jgi:hypothetical protein
LWTPPFIHCVECVIHGYWKLPFLVWLLNQFAILFWWILYWYYH